MRRFAISGALLALMAPAALGQAGYHPATKPGLGQSMYVAEAVGRSQPIHIAINVAVFVQIMDDVPGMAIQIEASGTPQKLRDQSGASLTVIHAAGIYQIEASKLGDIVYNVTALPSGHVRIRALGKTR